MYNRRINLTTNRQKIKVFHQTKVHIASRYIIRIYMKLFLLCISFPKTAYQFSPAFTQAYTQSEYYPRLELNIVKEDYVPYADGKFSDYIMSPDENPIETDQEMEYSAILNMYRLKSCWGTGTGSIIFSWEGDKVTLQSTSIATGINDATYGAITASLAEEATYDEASKTFTFPFEFLVSAGSFGIYEESYTITSLK